MAAFAELAGVPMPAGKDAVSYNNPLFGKQAAPRSHIVVDRTIITGDGWKLTNQRGKWLLFQITADPEERHNLAEAQPERLRQLQAIYSREVGSPRKDK